MLFLLKYNVNTLEKQNKQLFEYLHIVFENIPAAVMFLCESKRVSQMAEIYPSCSCLLRTRKGRFEQLLEITRERK